MQSKKRKKIIDSSGWTHIIAGPSNAVGNKILPLPNKLSLDPDRSSLDQLIESHQRYINIWERSTCWRSLADILRNKILGNKHLEIKNCVCLGLGSVAAGRVSSKHQLAALRSILRLLGETHSIKSITLQDPAFNDVDEAFLTELGFVVVPTPTGFMGIDNNTFLFAPHLENEIFATALQNVHPAICLGNKDVLKDQPLHSSATISESTADIFRVFSEKTISLEMPEYDQDSWCQFTSIYWLRDDIE